MFGALLQQCDTFAVLLQERDMFPALFQERQMFCVLLQKKDICLLSKRKRWELCGWYVRNETDFVKFWVNFEQNCVNDVQTNFDPWEVRIEI